MLGCKTINNLAADKIIIQANIVQLVSHLKQILL